MAEHKDWFESLMFKLNPPTPGPLGFISPALRPYPRFFHLSEFQDGQKFSASIPVARRTWWLVGWGAIVCLWVFALPGGVALSWIPVEWDYRTNRQAGGHLSWIGVSVTVIVLAVLTYVIWRAIFPRITIQADREGVKVGAYHFDWQHIEGFRMGYSSGGVERDEKQLWFHGLRIAYGPFGHDLPYLVRNYYVPVYVVYLNQLLGTIKVDGSTLSNQRAGIRQEMY